MTPNRRDPAALLREAFSAREGSGDELGSAARLGRARLTAAMATLPARQSNGWALGSAWAGFAAAALIGGAAFFVIHGRVPPTTTPAVHQDAAILQPAAVTVPAQVESAPVQAATPAPKPAPQMLRASHRAPRPSPVVEAVAPVSVPLRTQDSGLRTEIGHELRLAKSSGGILVHWAGGDGPASARQYELRKSCVDPRAPGAATLAARIRSNDGEWLDTTPDSCGSAATLYEVVPFGLGA